jgi:hypothetical protein
LASLGALGVLAVKESKEVNKDNVNNEIPIEPEIEEEEQKDNETETEQRDLAAEYLDALQRERANFINFRRRVDQEKAE